MSSGYEAGASSPIADIAIDQTRLNAMLLAENVYLYEALKGLAARDGLAAHMLKEFEKVRKEFRKTHVPT